MITSFMPIYLYSHWKDKAAPKNSKNKQAKSKLNAINQKFSIRVSSLQLFTILDSLSAFSVLHTLYSHYRV